MSSGTDALKNAFRDYQTDGIPATGSNEPDKGEIRGAIDVLGREIDDVFETVGELEAAVEAVSSGSADGIIVEKTLANLVSRATTLGLDSGDAGRGGRVYDDSTASNNGDYRWTGSAWEYLGADRIGQNEADIAALVKRTMQLTCSHEIIVDKANRIGGGAAIYIPDTLRLIINGETVISKLLTTDAKMTRWAKVAIADTSDLQTVYYDAEGETVNVGAMPVDPARYFHIISISGSMQGWAGANKIVSTTEWTATFATAEPIVFDDNEGKLYIPQLYGLRGGGSLAWNCLPLTANEKYREISVATTGSAVFVWADVYKLVADNRDAAGIVTSTGYNNRPSRNGSALALIGIVFARHFTPANPDTRVANIVSNQFGAGREDNDLADLIFPGSTATDLTHTESLALGFTRGYHSETSMVPYYGGRFPQARSSGFFFYRFYLETDVDDDFAIPRGYLHQRDEDGTTSYFFWNASLEKKHSANLAEYSGYISLDPDAVYSGFWCGTSGATHNGIRVFGVQFHIGPTLDAWVGKRDYPRTQDEIGARLRRLEAGGGAVLDIDPIVPPRLYIHPDRPYQIYADQMFGAAARGAYRTVAQSLDATYQPLWTEEVAGGTLRLPSAGIGDSIDFHFQNLGDGAAKLMASSAVRVLSPSAIDALTLKVLFLGDSITEWNGAAVQTVRRLNDMGVTVSTVGTMTQSSDISGDGQVTGEGRSSRRMADFYGLTQDRMAIVPVGDEATYLALDVEGKRGFNPFLKIADAGDIADKADMVRSGNIFDMAFYLDRFTLDDPDVVVINLATNDYFNEDSETAAQHVRDGLNILVPQTREALPAAKIILVYNTRGYAADNTLWETGFRACLKEYLKFSLETEDDAVFFVPGYCTINRLTGFGYNLTADLETGVSSGDIDDATHYAASGLREYGEVVAQFIAGAATEV